VTVQPLDREDVRLAVYETFRRKGRAPSLPELADAVSGDIGGVRAALADLHRSRDVVLGDEGEIVMAHPFTSVPLGFSVMGESVLWWGGCAWDSFAVPHLVDEAPRGGVATTCPGCDAALAWIVDRSGPPEGDEVAHFLTPAVRIWDDVVQSCANQRLFCSEACVERWLARVHKPKGYVMDLATLWRLAKDWYAGRLERGYRRRDPLSALDYFAAAGLRGSFWGLPDRAAEI
jgi:hypothetical protein